MEIWTQTIFDAKMDPAVFQLYCMPLSNVNIVVFELEVGS